MRTVTKKQVQSLRDMHSRLETRTIAKRRAWTLRQVVAKKQDRIGCRASQAATRHW